MEFAGHVILEDSTGKTFNALNGLGNIFGIVLIANVISLGELAGVVDNAMSLVEFAKHVEEIGVICLRAILHLSDQTGANDAKTIN